MTPSKKNDTDGFMHFARVAYIIAQIFYFARGGTFTNAFSDPLRPLRGHLPQIQGIWGRRRK